MHLQLFFLFVKHIAGLVLYSQRMATCSPKSETVYKTSKTCYTKAQLQLIGSHFNSQAKPSQQVDLDVSKATLLTSLKKHLPSNEATWVSFDFMKKMTPTQRKHLQESFRPTKPKEWRVNDRAWLSTTDILRVMTQYEKKYRSFRFLGVFPIDFMHRYSSTQCVSNEMCAFDVNEHLNKGTKQCGLILNLDKHYEAGSHWVSVYIGLSPTLPNFGLYYIDSNSTNAPREIYDLFVHIQKQIANVYDAKTTNRFVMVENQKRFQFKDTECGMFSMFFLTQFLKRKRFVDILKLRVDDDDVHKFRNVFYSPS